MTASIIIINGTSSAGKSSLARTFQAQTNQQWVRLSIDDCFRAFPAGANLHTVPYERLRRIFYQNTALWAAENFDLIIDTVFEEPACLNKALQALYPYRVWLVALHCPLEELERRERIRGNRPLGLARSQFYKVHSYCSYDLELNSHTTPVEENARALARLLQQEPRAFQAQVRTHLKSLPTLKPRF